MEKNREITISSPYIISAEGNSSRLAADVHFPDKEGCTQLWIEVDERFSDKLTVDRLDGFVVWLLPYAMQHGCSIVCGAPVSKRLLYQLNHYLLPTLPRYIPSYKDIRVKADTISNPLLSEGAAATGWTGGVDSMYTLLKVIDGSEEGYRLTHLVVMSCGALEGGDNSRLVRTLSEDARAGIGLETGLEIVRVDSNIEYLTPEPFLSVSDYRLAGMALCLQGLFSKFFLSSSYDFETTRFFADASCYYSLFSFPMLCTESLSVLPIGGNLSRIEKIQAISDSAFAQKYLHPCIYIRRNCGHCDKCIRTETALYAIGKLEKFEQVFDVEGFYRNKNWYLSHLLSLRGNQHCAEVISELERRGEKFEREVLQQARVLSCARKVVGRNKEVIKALFDSHSER